MNAYVPALILIELIALWTFGRRAARIDSPGPLQKLMIINMLLVVMFNSIPMPGTGTNAGCVLYATVMASQCVVCGRWGTGLDQSANLDHKTGIAGIAMVFRALVVATLLLLVLSKMADPASPHARVAAVEMNVAAVAAVAFWSGQLTLMAAMERLERHSNAMRFGFSTLCAQVVDSIIFFPLLFGVNDVGVEALAWGLTIKIALGFAFVPIIGILVQQERVTQ